MRIQNGSNVILPNFPSRPVSDSAAIVNLNVASVNGSEQIVLTENDLSRHVLSIGGIGSGKTNLIDLLTDRISQSMTDDDVMVIFDTKGDYLRKFARPGDLVFGNVRKVPHGVKIAEWNIYEEVMIDRELVAENLTEITKSLFAERAKHNTNPFFPNAARDILYGYMLSTIRSAQPSELNNQALSRFFAGLDIEQLRDLLNRQPDLKSCLYYIKGDNTQSQGVVSEVVQLVHDIFVNRFALVGSDSIRRAIRRKSKRRIFIEYDLALGNMLSPIYSLLLDMAIKEALSRSESRRGNVYLIIDEFSLLPNLTHISDGVNFGREMGLKIIVGIQSVEQLYSAYGEHPGGSILAGFDTRFFFKVNDYQSRKYVQELLGKNKKLYSYDATNRERGVIDEIVDGNVIEDWVYVNLPTGAAVFFQGGKEPTIVGLPRFIGSGRAPFNSFLDQRGGNPPSNNTPPDDTPRRGFTVINKR